MPRSCRSAARRGARARTRDSVVPSASATASGARAQRRARRWARSVQRGGERLVPGAACAEQRHRRRSPAAATCGASHASYLRRVRRSPLRPGDPAPRGPRPRGARGRAALSPRRHRDRRAPRHDAARRAGARRVGALDAHRAVQLPHLRDDRAGRAAARRRGGAARRRSSRRRRSGSRWRSAWRSRSSASPSRRPLIHLLGGQRRVQRRSRSATCASRALGLPLALIALAGQGHLRGIGDLRTPLVIVAAAQRR